MRKLFFQVFLSFACLSGAGQIVATDAYCWAGDTIFQGPYKAWSTDGVSLESTYSAQPGYRMPVDKEWRLSRDVSAYPQLTTPNRLHTAVYNLALEEMLNAIEPDTTLRTGREWAGVWTRDVSYSILLSMAYLQPEASRISLMKKVSPTGRIIQDTGSGGAWPVSTDRMVWALAAYEVYRATGDRKWLEFIYPVIANSMADDLKVTRSGAGLVNGETSFIDWREQSYPKWMQTADIFTSESLSTSVVHAAALDILARIARELGQTDQAADYNRQAKALAEKINERLWMDDKGYYAMYTYGRLNPILNPRAESLGESLAVLYDVAPEDQAVKITQNYPTTPFGAPVFYPQIADMPAYHNNALWPWVASYWALANAKVGNEDGVLEAIGSVFRPAALFTTNKENLVIDNGDIATELNSSNMLWCLAGNLALTHKILFGINIEDDGIGFRPFVPHALGEDRSLRGFKYRDAVINIHISGYGSEIKSFKINGKKAQPFLPADARGVQDIEIVMADNKINPLGINRVANLKAPLTPIARLSHSVDLAGEGVPVNNLLEWNPIEYIAKYIVLRDGYPVAETRSTSFPATVRGEYQVIGVAEDGTQSFASEPLDNYEQWAVEIPDEATVMCSDEVSYQPAEDITGWHGAGFAETDHLRPEIRAEVSLPSDGEYAFEVIYANGNGPVNTENKCAIRTLAIDDVDAGTIVMPQRGRGNWNDWGHSNVVRQTLKGGKHKISLMLRPENENMNLTTNHALVDRFIIKRIK